VIRDDLAGKRDNHCMDWETGDAAATEAVFASADVVVTQEMVYPRVHPGAVGDVRRRRRLRPGRGRAHAVVHDPGPARTPDALRARGRAVRHKIRVISPDIGGGFGNKVPIYPGTSARWSLRC
jgi:carbon-monoxide dehydrogenase large subunit